MSDVASSTIRVPDSPGRRGSAMIIVLVALAMTLAMFFAAAKLALVQRKTVELSAWQVQADWLAASALERAAARLVADTDYRGETWNISAEELGGRDGGTVTIRVKAVPGKSDRRVVHVEADYPSDPQQHARQDREMTLRTGAKP